MKKYTHYLVGLSTIALLSGCGSEETNTKVEASKVIDSSTKIQNHSTDEATNPISSSVAHTKDTKSQKNSSNPNNETETTNKSNSSLNTHSTDSNPSKQRREETKENETQENITTENTSSASTTNEMNTNKEESANSSSPCKIYNPITGGCEDR